jgi:hypothetical protein
MFPEILPVDTALVVSVYVKGKILTIAVNILEASKLGPPHPPGFVVNS